MKFPNDSLASLKKRQRDIKPTIITLCWERLVCFAKLVDDAHKAQKGWCAMEKITKKKKWGNKSVTSDLLLILLLLLRTDGVLMRLAKSVY